MNIIEEVKRDIESINKDIKNTEIAMDDLLVRDVHTRAALQKLLIQLRQSKDTMINRLRTLERDSKYGDRERELKLEKLEVEIKRLEEGVDDTAIVSLLNGLSWMSTNYADVRETLLFPEDLGDEGDEEDGED